MATPEAGKSEWNKILGPFYGANRVSRMLGLTEEQVSSGYRERGLLGCRTRDGALVFPAFQFVQNEQDQSWSLVEGLSTVVSVFADPRVHVDDWTLASWTRSFLRDLKGESIVDHLKAGKGVEGPFAIARDVADRWSE